VIKNVIKSDILDIANKFWDILDQTWKKDYLRDIKPTDWYDKNHPQKWTEFLDLHLDWFFKKLDVRPDYIVLYCINSGKWWETILCNLSEVFGNIITKYWIETYNKIVNLKCFWKNNIFYIWQSFNKIYQDIKYNYYKWPLMEKYNNKKYYCLSDNFGNDNGLLLIKKEIDNHVFCIWKLEKNNLIVINNFSYLHWRKKILSNDRHLIRIQLKERFKN